MSSVAAGGETIDWKIPFHRKLIQPEREYSFSIQ